jgi:hypothetical protein
MVGMSTRHPTPDVVGWREWVGLPDLGVPWVKAKIDTGAQTSSLHAFGLREFKRDGETWVRFEVHPWQGSASDPVKVELRVHDRRRVRSSTGHLQVRYVVMMRLRMRDRTFPVEMTLTRRDAMGFRLLIGREALRNGFVVDPAASYLGGKPPRPVRRANREAL